MRCVVLTFQNRYSSKVVFSITIILVTSDDECFEKKEFEFSFVLKSPPRDYIKLNQVQ